MLHGTALFQEVSLIAASDETFETFIATAGQMWVLPDSRYDNSPALDILLLVPRGIGSKLKGNGRTAFDFGICQEEERSCNCKASDECMWRILSSSQRSFAGWQDGNHVQGILRSLAGNLSCKYSSSWSNQTLGAGRRRRCVSSPAVPLELICHWKWWNSAMDGRDCSVDKIYQACAIISKNIPLQS